MKRRTSVKKNNADFRVDAGSTVADSTIARGWAVEESEVRDCHLYELKAEAARVLRCNAPKSSITAKADSEVIEVNTTPSVLHVTAEDDSRLSNVVSYREGVTTISLGTRAQLRGVVMNFTPSLIEIRSESNVSRLEFLRESDGILKIRENSEVHGLALLAFTHSGDIGSGCHIGNESSDGGSVTIENGFSIYDQARIGEDTRIGRKFTMSIAAEVGSDCRIADEVYIGQSVRVGDSVRMDAGVHIDDEAQVGDSCVLLRSVKVGREARLNRRVDVGDMTQIGANAYVEGDVRIGSNCTIGKGVEIGESARLGNYVVVDPGIRIGERANIASGVRVTSHVAESAAVEKLAARASNVDEAIEITADAESWILNRTADAMEEAGQKRLDKRALAKTIPTLVDTHCIKQLLKLAPPPTVAQLREMAAAFACTPKYEAERGKVPPSFQMNIEQAGWSSMQIMGNDPNDVILYRVASQTMQAFISEKDWTGVEVGHYTPEAAAFVSYMTLGKGPDHPGGQSVRYLGWARIMPYEAHQAILLEEIQTDLIALAFNVADELSGYLRAAEEHGGGEFLEWQALRERVLDGDLEKATPEAKAHALDALTAMALYSGAPLGDKIVGPRAVFDRSSASRWEDPDSDYWRTIIRSAAYYYWDIVEPGSTRRADEFIEYAKRKRMKEVCDWWDRDSASPATIDRDQREVWAMARKMLDEFRGVFGDWYESALAGVLIFGRKFGIKEVWMPDYETKYAIAAYGSGDEEYLAPPRSVYTDLPKRFQATPVQTMPSWIRSESWSKEAKSRRNQKWVKVQIPEEPRGRRLLTNRRTSRGRRTSR